VADSATITNHHGVGKHHGSYLEAEMGATALDELGAIKERLDPAAIKNPGKLLPSAI